MIKLHKQHKRDLLCTDCVSNGFSPGHYKEYQCTQCRDSFGSLKFDAQTLKHFTNKKTSNLVCEDCKSKLKCGACNIAFDKNYWTAAERKHASRPERQQSTALVCKPCRQNGYTPDDVKTYSCQACGKQCGWKHFDESLIHHFKHDGREKLLCKACVAQTAERIKILKKNLAKSKRVCKCGCPIHRPKCPLTPCYYNERRWPGSDGWISTDDRQFLDSPRPQPQWWTRAWGGTYH